MTPGALYLGLISGTSADGIDATLVRFEPHLQLVAALTYPYPAALRERVLALATSNASIALDDYGHLDVELGEQFASAASSVLRDAGIDADTVAAIGSHGQTVCHRPSGVYPFTLQIGDPSVIAERTGITTIADFRRADVAAGGQGAPLLPALHAAIFANPVIPRAILNLGGIANITVLSGDRPVLGFDTGPANCLLDAWAARHLGTSRDEGGEWARSGRVEHALLARWLTDPYFAAAPPKSTGREVFNLDWLDARLPANLAPADVQATLLRLSARSTADAIRAYAPATREVFGCGGGVHNAALMEPRPHLAWTRTMWKPSALRGSLGLAWLVLPATCPRSPAHAVHVSLARSTRRPDFPLAVCRRRETAATST